MPTKNPRMSFMISQEQLDRVEAFQHEHRIKSTSKAIVHLLNVGIGELEKESNAAPAIPPPVPVDLTTEMEKLLQTLSPEQAMLLAKVAEKSLAYVKSKSKV